MLGGDDSPRESWTGDQPEAEYPPVGAGLPMDHRRRIKAELLVRPAFARGWNKTNRKTKNAKKAKTKDGPRPGRKARQTPQDRF